VKVCRYCGLPLIQVSDTVWRHATTVRRQMSGRDDARYWTCGRKPYPAEPKEPQ